MKAAETVTYPGNEVVTTSYNSLGLPAKLTGSVVGDVVDGTQTIGTVATGGLTDAVSYDEAGRLTAMRFPWAATCGAHRVITAGPAPTTPTPAMAMAA
ncbi:MAG: hypothetical protein R3C14_55285 [Caldilineaceae bacterium]